MRKAIKGFLARYVVSDDLGTWQPCWTITEALTWLPYCGKHACVFDRRAVNFVAHRTY